MTSETGLTDKNIQKKHVSPMESEKISGLLIKFAIPSVVSMVVNALYNIVDQIFIGQGVGYLGNAATNVAFPLVTITMAVSLMTGNGAAALYSLRLGAKDRQSASDTVGSAVGIMIVTGMLLLISGLMFFRPLLSLFGATDAVMPYAVEYTRIIIIGLPFMVVSTGLNALIRADGSPKYSMYSMLAGAAINIVLDPLFIFVFDMGVAGAAVATIIGQFASMLLSLRYLSMFKNVIIKREIFRIKKDVAKKIFSFGASSFVTQMSITLVQITINNTIRHFGAMSVYGTDIPLSVIGIVMKVNMVVTSVILGIAIGSQPIWGYNYGAGRFDRVRKTYRISIMSASVFSITGFLVFQIFTPQVVGIFGSESQLYNEFAVMAFRIFLSGIFVLGFQITSAIYFQAVGKPLKSAFLSLLRQALLLAPLAFILPSIYGLEGLLYAGPVADITSSVVTAGFILYEMRKMKRMDKVIE